MEHSLTRSLIRDVPDFPKAGIVFKDITPVLGHPEAFRQVIEDLASYTRSVEAEVVAAIESRGFVFGAAIAMECCLPFVPIRKPGKLPYSTIREEYELEYGVNAVEIHTDAIKAGQRVVVIDDLLATGGTAAAAVRLIRRLDGQVAGAAFVVELGFLDGRAALPDVPVRCLIRYD